jgi:hypothetical protein
MDYLDIQISLDGIDAATNDAVRGAGSYDMARRAKRMLRVTKENLKPGRTFRPITSSRKAAEAADESTECSHEGPRAGNRVPDYRRHLLDVITELLNIISTSLVAIKQTK